MTISEHLPDQMADLYFRLAEVERRSANRSRTGTIKQVDNAKGLARAEFSEQGGTPYLGPWMPWKEVASGGIKSHIPPTVGEQVSVTSESGDLADGVIDMSVPSTANPRPHDGPEAVITKGNTRVQLGDDTVAISSTAITLTGETTITGNLTVNGGTITNQGKDVGHSHTHTGVTPGGGLTGGPA